MLHYYPKHICIQPQPTPRAPENDYAPAGADLEAHNPIPTSATNPFRYHYTVDTSLLALAMLGSLGSVASGVYEIYRIFAG
jgi:hypothetical protein